MADIGAAAHKNQGRRHRKQGDYVMPEMYRQKIKAGRHLTDLSKCAMGKLELSPVQVKCIEILLKKCLPDLAQQEHSGSLPRQIVIVSAVVRALAAPDDTAAATVIDHSLAAPVDAPTDADADADAELGGG